MSNDSDSDLEQSSPASPHLNGHSHDDTTSTSASTTPITVNGRSLRARDPNVRLRYSVDKYTNPHEYVECVWHRTDKVQPFQLCVERAAAIMIELHSHLAHTEVIGWLAGDYDQHLGALVVRSVYPVQSIELEDKYLNVEMDAVDASCQAEAIAAAGLQCVGWYHSHPYFENQPSTTDVQQHHNMQRMFHKQDTSHNRFVAAICVPYGQLERKRLHGNTRWLYTRNDNATSAKHSISSSSTATNLYGGKVTPYELWYTYLEYANTPATNAAMRNLILRAKTLYDSLADYKFRVDFSAAWAPHPKLLAEAKAKAAAYDEAAEPTRLTKLRASLAALLPEEVDDKQRYVEVLTQPLELWRGKPSRSKSSKASASRQR